MAIDNKIVKRAGSLGQLDREFMYGPSPLAERDIPIDLRARRISHDSRGGVPGSGGSGGGEGGYQDLSGLIHNVHSIAGTVVLRRGLLGRVETITSVPLLIVDQRETDGRGYLLLNPAGVVGLTAEGTIFSSKIGRAHV